MSPPKFFRISIPQLMVNALDLIVNDGPQDTETLNDEIYLPMPLFRCQLAIQLF